MSQLQMKVEELSKEESNYYHIQVGTCIRSLKHVAGNRLIWSDLFQEIQWNLGASNITEGKEKDGEGEEDNSIRVKSILKNFQNAFCLRITSTVRLWDQERCCQFIVTQLPKLGNLKWGSFWLLVKVLHNGDSLVLVVDVTSHQSSIDSFHWDHAELLLKAHCLVIFWSVIHKTYDEPLQCNQCSFKCQIFKC